MAYVELVGKSCANDGAVMTEIYTQLEAAGWTKFDWLTVADQSCASADVSIANNTITIGSHGFSNGMQVQYYNGGTVIAGMTNYALYFIVQKNANDFKVSTSQGGAEVDFTSQGVGTHYFREGYRVYSTDGEDAAHPTQYWQVIRGTSSAATNATGRAWYLWNATTHAGSGRCSSVQDTMTMNLASATYVWAHGDKDFIIFASKVGATYTGMGAGYVIPYWTVGSTLSQAETTSAGAKQIHLASTTGFIAGKKYQIFSLVGEGRDQLTCTTVDDASHITVPSFPRNYASGSLIGQSPCPFVGIGWLTSTLQYTFPNGVASVGLTDNAYYTGASGSILIYTAIDPDQRGDQKYLLTPIMVTEIDNTLGYLPLHFLLTSPASLTIEDTLGVTEYVYTTATSGAANTVTVSTASWTVDAYIGKAVIIRAGTGAGQIRKITDNDATSITVSPVFTTSPDSTSQFTVVDEAYRYLGATGSNNAIVCMEGHA